jgi:hypothetical protein
VTWIFTIIISFFFRFEFAVNQQDLDTRTLDISVKNSVGMFSKSRRNIGSVFIDLMKFDLSKAVTEW